MDGKTERRTDGQMDRLAVGCVSVFVLLSKIDPTLCTYNG